MNERIENLMLEATKDMPQGYYVPGEYFQKFAELIVRECAELVEYNSKWAGRDIREHFGVEE